MQTTAHIGRYFFSLAIIGLGIKHFVLQDFVTGRAPTWPEILPGKVLWAYLSGLLIITTGTVIIIGKKARIAAFTAGSIIFLWAFVRLIPEVIADSFIGPEWTNAGKALVLFSGFFAIAGIFSKTEDNRSISLTKFINLRNEFMLLGRTCLGIFFLITGVQHFIFTEFVASLVPGWFPGDSIFCTYFGGVALITGGIGLFIPRTAWLAALFSGVMIFSWFCIIHIPRAFAGIDDGIAVFEALAVAGVAFVIAGFLNNSGKV